MAVYRAYGKTWLVFFTSMGTGEPGRAECVARFGEVYQGRVQDGDWVIETAGDSCDGRSFLYLCVPNCCGEFNDRVLADKRAGEHAGHPHQVVERGSAEERELLAYGARRLR